MNNEGRKARTEDTEWQPKVRPRAMLIKLVLRFDPDQYRVRESASGLAVRGRGRRRARQQITDTDLKHPL